MNTLFLFLHLLFIILSIVNVACFMKLVNKISSKQSESTEDNPAYHSHVSKNQKVNTVVSVHRKECDDSVDKLQDKFMDIELELIKIKGGEVFTVLVDDAPIIDVKLGLNGIIEYNTTRDGVTFISKPKLVVMNLSEAKNIAEKLNGKVVFIGDCESVVYDYTKEK